MKIRKILVTFLLTITLFYSVIAFLPCGIGESYAADMAAGTLSRDIDAIDDSLYPGYKSLIKSMQSKHSNYEFLVYYTGMDWNDVLTAEYQGHWNSPLNLFQVGEKYNGMWMCPLCGTKSYDNGSWCCASKEALAYMMDPRNSINDSDIFQFKNLEGSDVSYNDIARVVADCGFFLNNSEAIQAIVDASIQYNVNGYFLVAKIINEHGKNGSTLSNGQGYNGNYAGVYNYFNIGSYGNGKDTIINNGLSYAQSKGWTSIRASIFGGTEVVRESYITRYSQNTLYYQKFNVSGRSAMASHQYQQNIMAAQSQGTSLKKYYANTTTNLTYTFIIPLYKNIPSTTSVRPDVTKANTITYENGKIKNSPSGLRVRISPIINDSNILEALTNESNIKIIKRATSAGANGLFWDLIVSEKTGVYGYAARYVGGDECIVSLGSSGSSSGTQGTETTPEPEPEVPKVEIIEKISVTETELKATPKATIEMINEQYPEAVIKNSKGEIITTGQIGTGYTVTIEEKEYTAIKKGDINGDGNANISDAILIINHLSGKNTVDGIKLEASKIKNQSNTTIADVIVLLNYLTGTANVEL